MSILTEHGQAQVVVRRFDAIGYDALWGGGSRSKGHGYWIRRRGARKSIRRRGLICGHFNHGNYNRWFQMHGEALLILRRLEAIK